MLSKGHLRILLVVGLFAASIPAGILSAQSIALADDPNPSPTPGPEETTEPEEPPEEDSDEEEEASSEDPGIEEASHGWDDPNSGVRIHWTKPQTGPRIVVLINNTTEPWRSFVAGRASQWGGAADIDMTVSAGSTGSALRQQCPMPDNYRRVRVCNYAHNRTWLGLARIRYKDSNGHIFSGRAELDDADLPNLTNAGLRSVMCQEIGHTLGLDHWRTIGNFSCMNDQVSANDAAYDQTAPHDLDQIDNQTHFHGGTGGNGDEGDPLNGDVINCIVNPCKDITSHMRWVSDREVVIVWRLGPVLDPRLLRTT